LIVFKKVKKTQQTTINECTVIQITSAATSTMVEVEIYAVYENNVRVGPKQKF